VTVHPNAIVVTIRISIADLIGGGGNTDIFPGRQTPSRRHCKPEVCCRIASEPLQHCWCVSRRRLLQLHAGKTELPLPVHRAPRQTQTMPAYAPCAHQQSTLVSDDRQRPIRMNRSRCLVYVSKKQCISCGCILAPHWRECHLCRVADNTV